MSAVIHQNSIEADDTKVSRTSLLREAGGEGECVGRRASVRYNWKRKHSRWQVSDFILQVWQFSPQFAVFTLMKEDRRGGLIFIFFLPGVCIGARFIRFQGIFSARGAEKKKKKQRSRLNCVGCRCFSSFWLSQIGVCQDLKYCSSILLSSNSRHLHLSVWVALNYRDEKKQRKLF